MKHLTHQLSYILHHTTQDASPFYENSKNASANLTSKSRRDEESRAGTQTESRAVSDAGFVTFAPRLQCTEDGVISSV